MNVLSLPDEMIASFTKYMNYEECQKARKMNQRIDSVAKKYNFDKMDLKKVMISNHNNGIDPFSSFAELEIKNPVCNSKLFTRNGQLRLNGPIFINTIEQLMKMARKVKLISLGIDITEELLAKLSEFGTVLRNTSLKIHCHTIGISAEELKNFANKMKVSRLSIQNNFADVNSLSDEVLADIDPSIYVRLLCLSAPKITVLGIQSRVFSNKLMLSLSCCTTGITFEDMVQFLKRNNTIESNMDFGIMKDPEIPFDTMVEELKQCGFNYSKEHKFNYLFVKERFTATITFEFDQM